MPSPFRAWQDLSWWWFNVLVYGMRDTQQLEQAIEMLEQMKVSIFILKAYIIT